MERKICLVTGASSGIGHATALELLRAGHTVYGGARRVERMVDLRAAGAHPLDMDVTSEPSLTQAVSTVLDKHGRVDVLVNNAGIGLYGAAEEVPIDDARHEFEVNLFAAARLIQLVLPGMRGQRSGTIVNVSSVGGELSLALGAWYHASKHALEAYSDSLRQEVARFGVRVVIVQPGLIRTAFQDSTPGYLQRVSGRGPYRKLAETMAGQAEKSFGEGSKASDPRLVATTIRTAVESSRPKVRYPVGFLARPLLLIDKLVPDRILDRLLNRP